MKKNRSKGGLVAMKVDLEKACDRISWVFLKQVHTSCGKIGCKVCGFNYQLCFFSHL